MVDQRLQIALGVSAAIIVVLVLLGRVPLRYNVRNLAVRWRTTLLTALAFTLVVGLLTVMLAFVRGMNVLTEQSGHGENVIVLSDGAIDELMSNIGYGDSSDLERQAGVARDANDRPLCSRETFLVVNQPIAGAALGAPQRRFIQVRGIDDAAMAGRVHGLRLLPGGAWFSRSGVQPAQVTAASSASGELPTEQLIQAVVGEGMAAQWGSDRSQPPLKVGDVFELGSRRWIAVGIMASEGSTFGSEIWAKRSIVAPMFGKQTYSSIVLKAHDAEAAKQLAGDLTTRFKKSAVQAQTETEYFAKLSETSRQFLAAIIFVAAVMALGGTFGVMNTMFAAIAGR
ncbi:MAG TPA: ABC transporter permease, partial [Pirellulales bacterium]|nr:ABC transporter permease [Pirellulales bacterium]